ncbi:MAG: aminodeoxychorismate synthase component I [Anaerolineae bacterium]|nr:aminodeoxychorismate synthase component I [Anaerolineae bacterium]
MPPFSSPLVQNHQPGLAIVQVDDGARWLRFRDPVAVVQTRRVEEIQTRLEEVANAVEKQRCYAAGFISYEAAPAFDAALPGRPAGDLPLVYFGLYRAAEEVQPETMFPLVDDDAVLSPHGWQAGSSRAAYDNAIAAIKDAIARGDTYQVNLTFPLHTSFDADPRALFASMVRAQRCRYAAYLDTGRHVVCSASPELFWELDGQRLRSRPMKGTAARGRTTDEDESQRQWLLNSAKNRAENVMIVDMVRNDMGHIARYGTVHVPALFETERYPTVWQMTSTVACETDASPIEIMAALFPCASITGAPKVRTMEIINELEAKPRGLYTGCIGLLAPDRRAQFNVAIRTLLLDRETAIASYGIGGGVVWDSQTDAEYDEALLKAQVLTRRRPDFELLETLLWTPSRRVHPQRLFPSTFSEGISQYAEGNTSLSGYFLLDRHLRRLADSASYFDVPLRREEVIKQLRTLAGSFAGRPQRVRVLVSQTGNVRCEAATLVQPAEMSPIRVGLARRPVDASDPFLFHKTTFRTIYDAARAARPDCDDVLLWNEDGEVTEATIANVVLMRDGELVTPPLASGLLAGTLRAELLAQGVIREATVRVDDLEPDQRVWLVNSVRGWRDARLVHPLPG